MKKILFLLLVLTIVPIVTVFASDNEDANYYELNMMLNNGALTDNASLNQVSKLSLNLSSMEKTMLYNSNKKSATIPFVLNFLVGFGLGSYVQGDTYGGNTALGGELGSLALMLIGYTQALNSYYSGSYDASAGTGFMVVGSIGILITRIFEIVRPFTYTSEYNDKLGKALSGISVATAITPDNEFKMQLAYDIKL